MLYSLIKPYIEFYANLSLTGIVLSSPVIKAWKLEVLKEKVNIKAPKGQ